MKSNFNVYHFFAGAFVPSWLLSRQEVSAGAKLTYAMLAQQANSGGVTQLNFRMQGVALGENEGRLAQHLMKLEEVGLIHVSRGNVRTEDIRVFFPPHPWMTGLEQAPQGGALQPAAPQAVTSPQPFAESAASAQASLLPVHPAVVADARSKGRGGRGRRRRRQSQSKHAFEVCASLRTRRKCCITTTSGT